jgi:hypothetical protein
LHNPQNDILSLALKLGTYTTYLLSVAICSKEKKIKEKRKNSKAQSLACLMSIVLSFVFALCY